MAFIEQAHVDDVGTLFRMTVYDKTSTGGQSIADISAATDKSFIFQKPNGSSFSRTASFATDGTDGIIQYVVVSGDLSEPGTWHLQGLVIEGGSKWYTDAVCFRVYENL